MALDDWKALISDPDQVAQIAHKYGTGKHAPIPRTLLRDPFNPHNLAYLQALFFHGHPLIDTMMLRYGLVLDRLVEFGRADYHSFFLPGAHTPEEFRASYEDATKMHERYNLRLKELFTVTTQALIAGFIEGQHLQPEDDEQLNFIYSLASLIEGAIYQWLDPDGQPTSKLIQLLVKTRMVVLERQLQEWANAQPGKPDEAALQAKIIELTKAMFADLPFDTEVELTHGIAKEKLDFYRQALGKDTVDGLARALGIRLPDDDEEELILH